jgi:hypothetical protein
VTVAASPARIEPRATWGAGLRAPRALLRSSPRGAGALSTLALLLALSSPASAATSFGADLSQEPDVAFGCEEQPFEPPVATGASSCTWTTDATSPQANEALQPPEGKGTITQVSVRVGAHTGPMKVVIMRVLVEFLDIGTEDVHLESSCCVDVAESESFTPTANAVTTVPVSLPVEVEGSVSPGLKVDDLVGLSVLELGVPIPARDDRSEGILDEPSDFDEFPAMQPGGTQLAGDPRGYQLLMNADWSETTPASNTPTTPAPKSNPTPTPTPTPLPAPAPVVPRIAFPVSGLASIKGNNALIDLDCGAAAACDGTVRLQSAPEGQASAVGSTAKQRAKKKRKKRRKKKAPVVTYASASFSLAAGSSRAIDAKLSSIGRRLARKHKHMKVWVNVTLTATTPAKVFSQAVTLRF